MTLYEITASLPVKLEITEGKGRRFQLKLTDKSNKELVWNIHHPETLDMRVDDSVFCAIISTERKEPSTILSRLKALIKGRPIVERATIEGEPYIGM